MSKSSRESRPADAIPASTRAARHAIDDALTRDRARLLGLWSRWRDAPGDGDREAAFRGALEASVAQRHARAAVLPQAAVDPALPIVAEADRIVALLGTHQVLVIAGETGSGKTTQLPKLCLAAGRGAAGIIGCTQPRRIAARTVARRVAEELQVPLGGAVGFQVRFEGKVSAPQAGVRTAVKFMTDGILLAEIQSDRWLSAYDTIIVDEAHERSLNIDFLLGYLKQLLPRRPDLKVIVTSATIDTARFSRHFDDAPVVDVAGRGHPVETRYRPLERGVNAQDGGGDDAEPTPRESRPASVPCSDGAGLPLPGAPTEGRHDAPTPRRAGRVAPRVTVAAVEAAPSLSLVDGIVAACDEIHGGRSGAGGDTLVFLPGEREIRDAHRALEQRRYRHTEVLPLYARLSTRDQDRVFQPGPQRRIVLATNVAETSLTVSRIHYVVDPGLARVKRYSARQKLDRLHIEPVSQASANQRQGRCGRIAPGVCIRLYSEADFASRPAYTDPEIRRAALSGVILRMLSLGLGTIEDFPFVEPPDPRAISDGWQQLQELGAVDDQRALTAIGRTMAGLSVDVKLARMLVAAQADGCLREMVTIASFLGIQDPRERPADQRPAADAAHAVFADPRSEFVAILRLWRAYRDAHDDLTQSQLRRWCERHFLGFLRMREWRELHRQVKLQCEALGWSEEAADAATPLLDAVASEPVAVASPAIASPADAGTLAAPGGGRRRRGRRDTLPVAARVADGAVAASDQLRQQAAAARYATLHRALLAGLPTQVGHRGDRGQYEGPRGRRFQLFPGSSLASRPPPWVLSATLLDTERVWSMTNAAIEPEWAIDALPHVLARRHFDPRWSRSQGRVVGSEQVSLFGLVLAPRRPVHYGGLYPEESRGYFLRDGLVAGEINTRSGFVARNRRTLALAEDEEAKQRRAGLVVDEDWMLQWYRDRVPSAIVSAQALDAWAASLAPEARRALEWTRDDLMVADAGDAAQFPDVLALGEARLAVRYRFAPGEPDDGMTLAVPLHLLNALDAPRLSWLAPGLVADKAEALIRGLPKIQRRHFVPAPDHARAFALAHRGDEPDTFPGALARFLKKLTGTDVAATDFDEASLDPHLRMNLCLLDAGPGDADGGRGRGTPTVLAESRDLDALRARFGARAGEAFAARASEGLAQERLLEFPQEPIPPSVPGVGGVPAYPALRDEGDSASLGVHADADAARALHPHGVRRLLSLALVDRARQARRQLSVPSKTALLYAAIESAGPRAAGARRPADHLRDDLVDGALAALTADGLDAIRDPEAFASRRDAVGQALFGEAMRRLEQAEAILGQVAVVRARLDSRLVGWARGNLDDMQAQLAALLPPGFLRDVPADALAAYPRYLRALAVRAERALNDPVRDQQRLLELKPFVDALAAATRDGVAAPPGWQALRWELEELRVSVFAQELGAKGGVSAKKLAARLAALRAT